MDNEYNGSKVKDFFIGFGAVFGAGVVSTLISSAFMFLGMSGGYNETMYIASSSIALIVSLIILGGSIYFGIKYWDNRKWISIGIIAAYVIPLIILLLVFGACLVMFNGF